MKDKFSFIKAVGPGGGTRKNDPASYVANHGIADLLDRAGYHIVLPIGGAQAGKTQCLMSLFRYLNSDPSSGYSIELSELLHYPEDHPIRQATDEWYYRDQLRSENFCILDATAFDFGKTMFIPTLITPVKGARPMKIAFVECMGTAFPSNPGGGAVGGGCRYPGKFSRRDVVYLPGAGEFRGCEAVAVIVRNAGNLSRKKGWDAWRRTRQPPMAGEQMGQMCRLAWRREQ